MFWRNTRAAIERFHPLHQTLLWQRVLSTSLDPAGWGHLTAGLAQHPTVVRRRSWQLPPRTLDLLVPLVQVLCQDARVIAVDADLRGDTPDKTGPRRRLAVVKPVRSAEEWYVVDPWLRVRAQLGDGSELTVTVVDRVRHRKINKTSRSGKHKTKQKTKAVQLVRVRRTLPRGVPGTRPDRPPPPWIRARVRDGKRRTVTASARVPRADTGADQVHLILAVAAETFRWTPPTRVRAS